MSKRHRIRSGDWESVIGRLEELVLANSGEDEFEEIFKLIVAKMFDELKVPGEGNFQARSNTGETSAAVNELLAKAIERWPGILPERSKMRLADEHLAVCVRALQEYSLTDTSLEVLDGFFEYLVNHSAKGAKGQFFTPRHVVDCCVKIALPNASETVADPSCGSGGFLVHAMGHVQNCEGDFDLATYARDKLWGFDFDQRAVRVAKALMLMAGDGSANIFRLNSLLTPDANSSLFAGESADGTPRITIEDVMRGRAKNFRGFDVILTNPPFAGEVQEEHLLNSFELADKRRRMERDVLFIERCVKLLRPGGRIAMVLPHNKLGSEAWSYARRWLVQRVQVVAVLGLGRATFLPHTHQKTSILFGIKRAKTVAVPGAEPVLFAVSERDGKDSRGQVRLRANASLDEPLWDRADHDLGDVVTRFHEFVEENAIPWRRV